MITKDLLENNDKFLLKINGVDLSDYVTGFSYTEYDISTSGSGLNDSGSMQLDVVAKDKRKLTINWTDCPSAYKKKIKGALDSIIFSAEWVSGDDDEGLIVSSYRGDRTYKMSQLRADKKPKWDVTVSIIGMEGA